MKDFCCKKRYEAPKNDSHHDRVSTKLQTTNNKPKLTINWRSSNYFMIQNIKYMILSAFMLSVRFKRGFAFTSLKTSQILTFGALSSTRRTISSRTFYDPKTCFYPSHLMMNIRDASSSSSSLSALTRTDIRKMKVVDLKNQLKARNLDDTGLRNDLMQRLLDHLEDTTSMPTSPQTKNKSNPKNIKKEKYISPEMQYVLRYSGLSIHGDAQGSCGLILYNSDTEKEVWSGYMFFQNGESAPEAEMKALLITIRNLLKLGVKHLIIQGYAPSAVLNQLQGNFGECS